MDHLTNLDSLLSTITPVSCLLIGIMSIPHCAGMCGPLSMTVANKKSKTILYQIGRLSGYVFVVFLGSLIGKVFFDTVSPYLKNISLILMSIFFIYLGINIYRGKGFKVRLKYLESIHGKISPLYFSSDYAASFIVGMSSVLLPCGLLYAVISGLVAMSNPVMALSGIFLFWLGSAPATIFAPQVINKILEPIARKKPRVVGFLIVLVALVTLFSRGNMSLANSNAGEKKVGNSCH